VGEVRDKERFEGKGNGLYKAPFNNRFGYSKITKQQRRPWSSNRL